MMTQIGMPGSGPSRIQGNPQDERHWQMRERDRKRERERDQTGMCSRVWQLLYFSLSPLYPKLVHF